MTTRVVAACLAALAAIACTKLPSAPVTPTAAAAEQTTPEPAPERAEARAPAAEPSIPEAPRPEEFVELNVPELEPSVVSFPPTAEFPQPVLVSAHGAGDSALQMCEYWRALLGDRGIVLCPAGPRMRAHEEGRYYPDHHALERITFAAIKALAGRYPREADVKNIVYTGYSQGATMGALMIPEHGAECPRLVLVEGGFDDWTTARAQTFKKAGGDRVLFACGRQACKAGADRSSALLEAAGVDVKIVARVGAGHTISVAEAALPEFEWLFQGDTRWAKDRSLPR